jgi:hypothetical protein
MFPPVRDAEPPEADPMFQTTFPHAVRAHMRRSVLRLGLVAAALALSTAASATADQNVMNVPGQAAMQDDQADIIQRTQRQAAIDSQKHMAHHRRFRVPPADAASVRDGYVSEVDQREVELESPSARQLELKRGSDRQRELEMPRGQGQKY